MRPRLRKIILWGVFAGACLGGMVLSQFVAWPWLVVPAAIGCAVGLVNLILTLPREWE